MQDTPPQWEGATIKPTPHLPNPLIHKTVRPGYMRPSTKCWEIHSMRNPQGEARNHKAARPVRQPRYTHFEVGKWLF